MKVLRFEEFEILVSTLPSEDNGVYARVLQEPAGLVPYHVALPASGLGWERAGLFERYSIKLTGQLDQRWEHCYRRIVASAPSLGRFGLDAAAASISFTCPATDGPVEVMGTLKVLEKLLERVNREASFSAAKFSRETG